MHYEVEVERDVKDAEEEEQHLEIWSGLVWCGVVMIPMCCCCCLTVCQIEIIIFYELDRLYKESIKKSNKCTKSVQRN